MDNKMILLYTMALCSATVYLLHAYKKKPRKGRQYKTRFINRDRKKFGFLYFQNLKKYDAAQFFKYTRMRLPQFEYVLNGDTPMIKKLKTKDGITPEERLSLTLHYLSQGCSMQSIAWQYHMGLTTVHKIIKETCDALYTFLSPNYLKPPSTATEWLEIAHGFMEQWNFPNCIGALDGKHIAIQAPGKSGSQFYNYKKHFSVVLLASCDANYVFRMVDIGAYGSSSDGGIFRDSVFGDMLQQDMLGVPPPTKIPGTNIIQPYVLVADEAFPLRNHIMRPYPGRNLPNNCRIFNYRLSRARRCIENAFGIMTNRWRLLRTTIVADVENIDSYIKAIVCLHNFLRIAKISFTDNAYCPKGFVDGDGQDLGSWRDGITPLQSVRRLASNRASRQDIATRDTLCEYFMSDVGLVPWQFKVLTDGFV